jgi:hypothetical protein
VREHIYIKDRREIEVEWTTFRSSCELNVGAVEECKKKER